MGGEWVGPTVAVWAGALIGAAYKLAFPVGLRRPSLVAFAALASFVLFGLRPTLVSMAPPAVGLILAGVALYMVGAAIHHRPILFHTPIWHGFVIVGAACHFAAVLEGVVLVPGYSGAPIRWQGDQARGAADPGQAPLWCRTGVVREGSAAVGNWHEAAVRLVDRDFRSQR